MTTTQRSYRYRLDPTVQQRRQLVRLSAARRFVWNWALETRVKHYRRTGTGLTRSELGRALTQLKRTRKHCWLNEADSQSLQQALADLDHAFELFFERKARFPRFKSSKRDPNRFRIPQRVVFRGSTHVRIPKVGLVRIRLSREPLGRIGAATFKEDSGGNWHVSFVTHQELEIPQRSGPLTAVGLDLGLRKFATLSNEVTVDNPRFLVGAERRLRREHRSLSRKRRGSRNRARQRARLAKSYSRIRNKRNDFLHKLTTDLVREYDVIAIEDLNVSGLARAKLARQIHDAAFSEFRIIIAYKSVAAGCELFVADRYFASSKTCSVCNRYDAAFSSKTATWHCECGAELDRDLNAARNLLKQWLAAGGADSKNACGADVRASSEAGRHGSTNPSRDRKSVVLYSSSPSSRR